MSVETLHSSMAENHGLLIQHHPVLSPKKLLDNLQKIYGEIHVNASFEMTSSSDYLTAVFFEEQKSGERCYLDFLHIAAFARQQENNSVSPKNTFSGQPTATGSPKKNVAVVRVGWINDNFLSTWQAKPYIRSRFCSLSTDSLNSLETSPKKQPKEGFLIVFWKSATSYQRMEIEVLAAERTTQYWKDEKEGGRLFLRFSTEEDALLFRDIIVSKFTFLSRFVSLAEEEDFRRARGFSSSLDSSRTFPSV